jgi:putative endonuclease
MSKNPLIPAKAGTQAAFPMSFYVYMMASGPYGTLYVGHTDDLAKRVEDHKQKVRPKSFTAKYGVDKLVWFETFELRENAFRRERQMKEWRRKWKIELIEADNPTWADLGEQLNNLLGFVHG